MSESDIQLLIPRLTLPRLISEDEEFFLRASMQNIGDVAMNAQRFVDVVYISHAPKIIPRMIGFVSEADPNKDQLTLSAHFIYREPEYGKVCLNNPTLTVDEEGFIINSKVERIAYFIKEQRGGIDVLLPNDGAPTDPITNKQLQLV